MAVASGITAKQALSFGASALSALGAIRQGIAAQQAADFDAEQLRLQAERDRQIFRQQSEDLADREARKRATLRARAAGSGITLEGTPLAVLSDLAGEAEFQRLRVLAAGETAANRAEGQASLRRFQGRQARTSGFAKAGTTLLTGLSKFA